MMLTSGRSVSSTVGPFTAAALPRSCAPCYQTFRTQQPATSTGLASCRRRSCLRLHASSSSSEVTASGPGVTENHPIVPLVATVGFVAAWFNKYSAQREHVLLALAAVALAQAATSIIKTGVHQHWVSSVAAPAVLAWHALNLRFHYMEVAIAVFGWYLCKNLEGPALAWAGTLGVALYSKMGAEWYAAAYGVVAAWKLLRGYQGNSQVALQLAPPILASAWALYKKMPLTWTVILMLSQIAGSVFGMVQSISSEVSS